MNLAESALKYPALMAYILDRNNLQTSREWCDQLRIDEGAARVGELSEVAEQMKQAQADYAIEQRAKGYTEYPYNSAMGEFLGLPIQGNHEPEHGYYMASSLMHHYTLGVAQRRTQELIAEGRAVRFVLAKDRKTGKPIRFATFQGAEQIKVEGQTISLFNGKRRVILSSNWSTETAIVNFASHLESGEPLGA